MVWLWLAAAVFAMHTVAAQPHQLCINGQSAPYCICGTERQVNPLTLNLQVLTDPPDDNVNLLMGLTLDYAVQASPQTAITLIPYNNGVPMNAGVNLVGGLGGLVYPPPPWPAGTTNVTANFGCTGVGIKCTGGGQFFWELHFIDQNNVEMLCVRTQVWG